MTNIPQPGPQAAATAVARAGRPLAGTVASATGISAGILGLDVPRR
jgi:hypothetical protein